MIQPVGDAPDSDDLLDLLPAWFAERFSGDYWSFGLLLDTGQVLAVHQLLGVTQDAAGDLWLDVEMIDAAGWSGPDRCSFGPVVYSPTSRTTASVAVSRVVAAFELADT